MRREFRLTQSIDLIRVRRSGKSYAHPLLVLMTVPNALPIIRVGVVATRAVGNSVERNRAKRRLRVCLDAIFPNCTPGWDIILLARRMSIEVPFDELQNAVMFLLSRAGLLVKGKVDEI